MTVFFGNSSGAPMADRRYDMAAAYMDGNDFAAAADLLRQGIEIAPHWPPLHFQLGEACRLMQQTEEAQKAFEAYLALDPRDSMGAAIKLSLMGATASPESMPPAYVQSLFDQYAPRFEKSLVEKLGYNTPEILHRIVTTEEKGRFENVLDLGCGTGLAAALFTDASDDIEGVDLSSGMIAIAREKHIYSDLHVDDIDSFLGKTKKSFNLILSADVFVYMGALEKTFEKIAAKLLKDGLFVFSVQMLEHDAQEWSLTNDHRYSHSRTYIEKCLHSAGIFLIHHEEVDLRKDGNTCIRGLVFLGRK